MPSPVFDADAAVAAYVETLNRALLSSINDHGLLTLDQINKSRVLPNVVFGSHATQKTICVNAVDFSGATENERSEALRIALSEEYMGIFGISCERISPLEQASSQPEVVVRQLASRLQHQAVFVLKPPAIKLTSPCAVATVSGGAAASLRRTPMQFGYEKTDGFSRSRGKNLFSKESVTDENDCITEIKTSTSFSIDDVLFVLVPSHLIDLAKSALPHYQDKLISVPVNKRCDIFHFPEMLNCLHGETMQGDISLNLPDYESVLKNRVLPAHSSFSLHAVRMHTPYDVTVRYVKNSAILTQVGVGAHLLKTLPGNAAWLAVHKSKLVDLSPGSHLSGRLGEYAKQCSFDQVLRQQIMAAKGDYYMLDAAPLSREQQLGLASVGSHCVSFRGKHRVAYHSAGKALVKDKAALEAAGRTYEVKAATKVQAFFRGARVRRAYRDAQVAQENFNFALDNLRSMN